MPRASCRFMPLCGITETLSDVESVRVVHKCSNEILSGLGKMYAGGGEFTENINKMGGEGTAEFTHRAIQIYCG